MQNKLVLSLAFTLMSALAFSQVTVSVFINGIMSGQYNIKANQTESGGISYKKSVYKSVDRLSLQIKGKSVDGGYIRSVDVMGEGEEPIFTASETQGVPGQFILTDKQVLKFLSKGKPITLYVEKTPANTKSMEPSSKVYIGKLTRE